MALAIARHAFRDVSSVGVTLALVTACASSGSSTSANGPRPIPTPPPAVIAPPPAAVPNVAPPASHPFAYAPGTYRYEIRSDAVITLTGDSRVDTVSTRAIVTLQITRTDAAMLAIAGSVDTFVVTGSRLGAASQPVLGVPFAITASLDGQVHDGGTIGNSTADSIGVCATPVSGVVATGKELFAALPVPLAPAAEWTDSATTVTCRAALPVIARSVRHSRAAWAVVPADWSRHAGDLAFEVARTTATTISGQGRAAGRQVDLGGSGEGSSLLYIDPELGVLLGGTGNGSTKIVLDAGSQRQEFVQTVHQQFRLLR
jgi:hypothetical protein